MAEDRATQQRKGTTNDHSTVAGLEGEISVDTDKNTAVVHDGSTQGGYPLIKESDFEAHTDDDSIHFTMGDIEIQESQITDLREFATISQAEDGVSTNTVVNPEGLKAHVDNRLTDNNGNILTVNDYTKNTGTIPEENRDESISGIWDFTNRVNVNQIRMDNHEQGDFDSDGDVYFDSSVGLFVKASSVSGDQTGGNLLWSSGNFTAGLGINVSYGSEDEPTLSINLTQNEFEQLQNIGTNTISNTQWGYLGNLDQNLSTSDNVTFNTVKIDTNASTGTTDLQLSANSNIGSKQSLYFISEENNNDTFTWEINSTDAWSGRGSGNTIAELGSSGLKVYDDIEATGSITGTIAASNVTEISNLTASEGAQLENIGSNNISNTQWGYLGNLNQNLRTTDSPTFEGLTINGSINASGQTANLDKINLDNNESSDATDDGDLIWDLSDGLYTRRSGTSYQVWDSGNDGSGSGLNADMLDGEHLAAVGVPSGGIIMWSGSTSNIPDGWYLCDGNNGTPDLRDRMVVGAGNQYSVDDTGGSDTRSTSSDGSHSHSSSTSVTVYNRTLSEFQIPSHDHFVRGYGTGGGSDDNVGGDGDSGRGTKGGSNSSNTGGGNSHDHGADASTSIDNNGSHNHSVDVRSKYYALAFIMKA